MSSSTYVPDEVWSLVFDNLDRKEDRRTVDSLRRTNKRFHKLVDPLVYWVVEDSFPQNNRGGSKAAGETGQLQQCAWRVAENPELCRYVKKISLRQELWQKGWQEGHRHQAHPSSLSTAGNKCMADRYAAALEQSDLPPDLKEAVLEKLRNETLVGHLSFLLAVCPDIEVLEINNRGFGLDQTAHKVMLHATSAHRSSQTDASKPAPSMFRSIREISLVRQFDETPLRDALGFLSLPKLEILNLDALSANEHYANRIPILDEPACLNRNPVKFVLDSCLLNGQALDRLLASCASPHSLTVRWRPGLWNSDVSNDDIGKALRNSGSTLKFLHVDTTDLYNSRYTVQIPTFGSFAPLTSLRTLAIPNDAFSRGRDCNRAAADLPQSLKNLYLLGIHKSEITADPFDAWKDGLLSQLPTLGEVITVPWHTYPIDEWFRSVSDKSVDYNVVEGLMLKRSGG